MSSRKDYIAISDMLVNAVRSTNAVERAIGRKLTAHFADVFAADNPRFDRDRFLDACGVNDKDVQE